MAAAVRALTLDRPATATVHYTHSLPGTVAKFGPVAREHPRVRDRGEAGVIQPP